MHIIYTDNYENSDVPTKILPCIRLKFSNTRLHRFVYFYEKFSKYNRLHNDDASIEVIQVRHMVSTRSTNLKRFRQ